jgi:hypothetical protein
MNLSRTFCMPNKWTFEMKPIHDLLVKYIFKARKVLIPFAGMTRFSGLNLPEITYIDIDTTRPQPCLYGDCLEVMATLKSKYDLIISDPPFCFFQAVHTYHNQKLQDISYAKELYEKLLTPNGMIIHFGFNSTGMGETRGYEKKEILLVNQGGSHSDLIITIEQRKGELK